jgi:hypothetical protein
MNGWFGERFFRRNARELWRRPVVPDKADVMRARRALAIAITTPVLLATIGMTGASAATPQQSAVDGPAVKTAPATDGMSGEAGEFGEDELRPEEGLVYRFANQLVGRFVPGKTGKADAESAEKS